MKLACIANNPHNPVFVTTYGRVIELRIGERLQGQTRYVDLTPEQAQEVAAALLQESKGVLRMFKKTKRGNASR